MKKLLFALSIVSAHLSFSQISFEKKYQAGDYISVQYLEGVGYKWKLSTQVGNALKTTLYNENHSVYKTFTSPTITLNGARSISSIYSGNMSTLLFNTNNTIEYVLNYTVLDTVCYFVGQQKWCGYLYDSFSKVVDENGTVLLSADSTRGSCEAVSFGANWKFVVDSYKVSDGAVVLPGSCPYCRTLVSSVPLVYSLPGKITEPLSLKDEDASEKVKASLSAPIPNPSSESTKIEFSLPNEAEFGEITVYNNMGLKMKSYKVDNTFGDLILNNQDLPSGSYNYQLVAGGKRIGSQKMLVIK